jgi:hypothetical protein
MTKSSYPYVTTPTSLRRFLESLPTFGLPPKVTQKWLQGVGYKSSNERRIIPVLKFVGLVSPEGVPTDLWRQYGGGAEGRVAFAQAIRRAYGPLFQTFPDAHRRDKEALLNFFRANVDLGEETAKRCVATFKVLVEFADFQSEVSIDLESDTTGDDAPKHGTAIPSGASEAGLRGGDGLTLNISIQLQLPNDADGKTYEELFAAMGKHLKELRGIG